MDWNDVQKLTILRCQVGSGVHGTAIEGTDDRDEMGICLEPPEYVIGLKKFEQYEYRTQPQGVRSGPGDLDLTIYSARKWLSLALKGNPSILLPLFVHPKDVMVARPEGLELRTHSDLIISRQAGNRFLGYLQSQKHRLLGLMGGKHTNRPELIEKYGFDTKYAMHMIRLGLQGVELLSKGYITLPVPEPDRSWLRELRIGNHTKDEAIQWSNELENELRLLCDYSDLPDKPDYKWANEWLINTHLERWEK